MATETSVTKSRPACFRPSVLTCVREYYLWYPLVSDGNGVTDELSHGFFKAKNGIGDFLAALKGKVIPITTIPGLI